MIAMIAAIAEGGVIGNDGEIPWHLPGDLKAFKSITMMYRNVVMGRKTAESIARRRRNPRSEILPDRRKFVLTRNQNFSLPGCEVVKHWGNLVSIASPGGIGHLVVIGGAEIYNLFLPVVEQLIITRVHKKVPGSVFFPHFNPYYWKEVKPSEITASYERDSNDECGWHMEFFKRQLP